MADPRARRRAGGLVAADAAEEREARRRHPTQKPLQLLDRIVRAGSTPDDLVLDPFNGSGTTGVAALAAGRRYVGIDVDRAYLDLTKTRIADLKL